MPSITPIKNSFNAGEWSPRMFGRTDLEKYQAACHTLLNFQITPEGSIVRRSGSRFLAEAKDSTKATYVIPFIFSDEQAYIFEIGDLYIRVYRNEGFLPLQVLTLPATDVADIADEMLYLGHGMNDQDGPLQITTTGAIPTGLSLATNLFAVLPPTMTIATTDIAISTDTITETTHGLSDQMGPFRLTSSITMPAGLSRDTDYYIIVTGASTFQLSLNPGGGAVDITSVGTGTMTITPTGEYKRDKFRLALTAGGAAIDMTAAGTGTHTLTPTATTVDAIEIVTPYAQADLATLSFAQSADVLYIAHKNYEPRKLSRFSAHGFFLEAIDFLDGPYLAENVTDQTMVPSAATGTEITITSSLAIFTGNDVGRPIRIKSEATPVHWGYAKITAVNPLEFTDVDIESELYNSTSHVNTSLNELTTITHGMDTGEEVRLDLISGIFPGATPALVELTTRYFVRAVSTARIKLYLTKANAISDTSPINLTSQEAGTFQVTTTVIDLVGHGYVGNDGPLTLSTTGVLPAGLLAATDYYVGFVNANSLTLSLSKGGSPVGITGAAGGGTHTASSTTVPFPTCKATVRAEFEAPLVASTAWRLGAWGVDSALGFPRATTFFEQRLWWSSNPGAPQTVYASKAADFESMSPTGSLTKDIKDLDDAVADDNAIVFAIAANEVNVINWFAPTQRLVLGTTSNAWVAQAALSADPISPANLQVRPSARKGSNTVQPLVVDDRAVYISQTGLRLLSLGYSFDSDTYTAEDLTLLSEHITRTGIVDIAYANEPWSTVWAVRTDGVLAAQTLIRDQEISGWARHVVGGAFVSSYSITFSAADITVADDTLTETAHGLTTGDRVRVLEGSSETLPAPLVDNVDYYLRVIDANTLAFYMSERDAITDTARIDITSAGSGVSHTMGTATAAVVESIAVIPAPTGDPSSTGRANRAHDQVWMVVKRTINGITKRHIEFFEDEFSDDDMIEDAFMVDCGLSRDGVASTSVSGLTHLANELVDVLADGVVREGLTVSGAGVVTLPEAAGKVHVGLHYNSDFRSLRMAFPTRGGSTQTKRKRIDHIVLRLNASLGGRFGSDEFNLDDLSERLIPHDLQTDTIAPPFSGDVEVPFDAPWDSEGQIFIRQDQPLPFSLVALVSNVQIGQRGDRL